MKRSGLIINYLTFVLLFLSLLFQSSSIMQASKFALIVLNAYFLYRITTEHGKLKTMHKFNYLFIATTIVFVVYATTYRATLYPNLILEFVIGALIGLSLSVWYKEGKKRRVEKQLKLVPPTKPQAKANIVREPVSIKNKPVNHPKEQVVKKTTNKKTTKKATKKSAKKVTKKTTTKRVVKKKAAKKGPVKKKINKKKASKKKMAAKRTAKKVTKRKVAKKKVVKKKPAKKKVTKRKVTKKTTKKAPAKKIAKKVAKQKSAKKNKKRQQQKNSNENKIKSFS